jgi:voltage-gated potassium channel
MSSANKTINNLQYQLFIVSISLLAAANGIALVFMRDTLAGSVLAQVDLLLTPFFLADFVLRLVGAPSKTRYFFRQFGWADLLGSLWVPGWDILRLFRIYRVVAITRSIPNASGGKPWRVVRRERANSVFGSMIILAILVLQFGGIAILHFESASPNANITTAGDALWWGIVTISTVGYGDKYPVTSGGRAVGTTAIIVGVALFSTIAAFLATAFISRGKQVEEKEAAQADKSDALLAEVKRLAAELEQRDARLEARLAASQEQHAAAHEERLARIETLLAVREPEV